MNDILGNALQKLASAESSKTSTSVTTETACATHLSQPAADVPVDPVEMEANQIVICSGGVSLATKPPADEPILKHEQGSSEPDAAPEAPPRVEFTNVAPDRSLKTILLRNPLPILQAHRRRVAAAVVLFCMAVIWSEENSLTKSPTAEQSTAEMTSVESLLADFATIDSRSMRDPAEPVSPASPPYQLSIPPSHDTSSAGSESLSALNASTTTAEYAIEDTPSGSGLTGGSPFLIPNSAPRSTPGSTPESGSNTGVRFTGRIQPLK